jgi:hypothetical protein
MMNTGKRNIGALAHRSGGSADRRTLPRLHSDGGVLPKRRYDEFACPVSFASDFAQP